MSAPPPTNQTARLAELYRGMLRIRAFERAAESAQKAGKVNGAIHLSIGQEAVAAGVCLNLDRRDVIASTHRGHGHTLMKGADPRGMMAELFGRATGVCGGKGGSMHIADTTKGMLGANGIVGAGAPQAVGAAIATKLDGKGRVAVAFSGDGACNQGTTFEAMNMAVVLKVPAIFVFENNHYSEHTGVDYSVGTQRDIASRAEAFGMRVWRANGCDFFDSYEAMRELLEYVRAGNGPAAIEFDTERFFGHFEGDPQRYRGPGELERIRAERDCLVAFRNKVIPAGLIDGAALDQVDAEVVQLIDEAVREARAAEPPRPEDVLTNVYAEY